MDFTRPRRGQRGLPEPAPGQGAVGTDIVDALLDGARLIEVSAGDLEYSFETHGFPQTARSLIESC